MKKASGVLVLVLTVILMLALPVMAAGTVTYSGQGIDDYGKLETEICGIENGAEVDGPYLLWVMTATKSTNVTITGPWGTVPMVQSGGGAFKYVSAWYDPATLVGVVSATFDGEDKNPQLVISHGCAPVEKKAAWCSPGYWKNAESEAWALVGVSETALFNSTVYDYFFGKTYDANPTLRTVLSTNGGTYKGAPTPGTSGYELNAFNATGAYLTNMIPGYRFDWDLYDSNLNDEADCPLDHHGNLKN